MALCISRELISGCRDYWIEGVSEASIVPTVIVRGPYAIDLAVTDKAHDGHVVRTGIGIGLGVTRLIFECRAVQNADQSKFSLCWKHLRWIRDIDPTVDDRMGITNAAPGSFGDLGDGPSDEPGDHHSSDVSRID